MIKNPQRKSKNDIALRRYPAEWELQSAVWLSCPHNEKEWGKKRLPEIRQFYKELIDIILDFQDVKLIFPDEGMLKNIGAIQELPRNKKHKLHKIIIPNNDIWIRDYGPFFLHDKTIVDFQFNAWGGKFPPYDLDNKVPKNIAFYLGESCESYPIVLEGGAIDFNGEELAITTEECVLNKNRNPHISKEQIENIIKDVFNVKNIIWLKHGLKGDHTDGHVDNVARFVAKNRILISKSLETKNELLQRVKNHNKQFEIIEVPLPSIKYKNKKLPASYINFIFVNSGIIVPTFNVDTDKEALEIFKKIFPDRKIIGIDSSLLIQEGGGLHCITKQEPKG